MMFWTSADDEDGCAAAPAPQARRSPSRCCSCPSACSGGSASRSLTDTFNDSHFHLTNYIQKGIDVRQYLKIMGSRVGRSTLFGIPLQQQWSYGNSGDFAPTYYLQTDAPLYYYSFTDAYIASAYRVAAEGGTGALRSDDHRVQSGGHVRASITSAAC